ncbi:hypothetical protein ACFU93_32610 [Streptomyces sp. NPDC057611]|uniref:hypothetical protein n=1 Tax=Streptomyces sp. NPDC057611 TaxID=3346182 RepID=UPI00368A7AC9
MHPVKAGRSNRPDDAAKHAWGKAPKVTWPMQSVAEVDLQQGGARRAGDLPLYVADASAKRNATASKAHGKVKVTVADRAKTHKAGVDGLLVALDRQAESFQQDALRVEVDYSAFRGAYGGDWAARLRLVEMPACAWQTPELAKCRVTKCVVANRILFEWQRVIIWTEVRVRSRA